MSGGPILNEFGEVVGIAVEKPNNKKRNSIIGVDFTTIDNLDGQSLNQDESTFWCNSILSTGCF